MADQKRVTRDDVNAAAERIAARDGITVDELRERVRNPKRTCSGCGETFAAKRGDKGYCTTACRARHHRTNGSEPIA